MSSPARVPFEKGHGTGNDFVIVPNLDGKRPISAEAVARLCRRHFGIGADGALVVTPGDVLRSQGWDTSAQWFMDYRNADGSVAEMCGNGLRVFARFLVERGLEAGPAFLVGSRAGDRWVTVAGELVGAEMGEASGGDEPHPWVVVEGAPIEADAWWMPNPHAVVFVNDVEALPSPLPEPVVHSERFDKGVNVEYVSDLTGDAPDAQLRARVRVHERGVGETLSCGTGACAVSMSLRKRHARVGAGTTIVEVPGGVVEVRHDADGKIELWGPAVLVAEGTLNATWLEGDV